ncbi:hypothetical protein HELRODRAFT_183310 [Helobdella robusta]|uniref:Peptidase C1A papain C-terminal domain-containing protein n=1 Tax=Helobdella robusta TaxID=6412 RepID=T1FJG1_HELRO|nr:hypothetical protein HELRODRAFT_183310 [Helobdella robusta]ESO11300.1 hypothetical protein HELRODRAFT_183310 [Helobdella robusta]
MSWLYSFLMLCINAIVAYKCFYKFMEDEARFCSCDHANEVTSLEALVLCSMRCSQRRAGCVAYNFFNLINQRQLFNETLGKFSVLSGCQYYFREDLNAINETLTIDVVNKLEEFYTNGRSISVSPATFPHANDWDQPDHYNVGGDQIVIAVEGYNDNLEAPGSVVSTNSSTVGWYKINYNDSLWPAAKEYSNSFYKSAGSTAWNAEPSVCKNCKSYCRKSFISNFYRNLNHGKRWVHNFAVGGRILNIS